MKSFKKSKELYKKGLKNLVGSVNSPVRSFASVGGNPLFIDSADKSKIKDVDGNEYIDYVLSYGPMILGHKNKEVQKSVTAALKKGSSFGASTEGEIRLSEIICDSFSSIDKIRFVNSGTEAVFSAIRLARTVTKRNKIIKFSGCYHGHTDSLLVAAGSGLATLNLPSSKGVPQDAIKNTLIAEYNNIESVKKHFKKYKIAAVIIEPVAGNMGVVIPNKKFVRELNALVKLNKSLLIVDEVMTGFRAKFGGTQDLLGFKADITCLGKVIGGGFPVGAYGASAEIMDNVAPLGGMYQAGTLSGNPIAMAAGISTLEELKEQNPYDRFEEYANKLKEAIVNAAKKNGVDIVVNQFGSMINPFFTKGKVKNFTDAQTSDTKKFSTFFWEMIHNGIFIPPSQFEAWFLSSTLTKKDIEKTAKAIDKSMSNL